ncbi:type III-B CRISPR module-associated protein Cmr5 [Thermoanaerobacter sp. CM-CNRG TB177]|jgi:CRISPR-associated protein Cmr5|uniref:CRISPR type III-B/RAMP module-associated protein Cmr5 n=2 Tax=Thermoanaerobacter TaxID=1754 RepID=D3T7Q5_THEIA|nr:MULTISPECIES: type III-B CRISPR module-associated protein Cmr5 [Thermoanaerobacter]MBZ4656172.1 CRISPR-associated protein Cmr5 family [Thermoanaerobacter sp.]ADD01987.1 CRISPR-associated protein, Cmr5 family [Thermoanaerobacter italicus Ab9]MBT1279482.1 type III-B CRISPR module-associated protein Cmr5 [Thermoanaerobacter sp. CM-CNRG TB177]MDK2814888.1 CRISPR-associated protein Cmr5 [Thermoanaerobacter sp.]MDP9750065.1 CRISPR-associated protein Cmr5 [Thermoanaerobacter pentosaceus]
MTDKDSIKTTVNERAKFAYECVKKVATYEKEEFKNNYKSYAKKLMAIIKTNGLGATLAFMKAKGSSAYQELYNNIDSWLKSENCPVSSLYSNSTADMVEKIISLESDAYRAITKEVMEFINWIRRFAEGMIPDDK